jgi:hypothetical protein
MRANYPRDDFLSSAVINNNRAHKIKSFDDASKEGIPKLGISFSGDSNLRLSLWDDTLVTPRDL